MRLQFLITNIANLFIHERPLVSVIRLIVVAPSRLIIDSCTSLKKNLSFSWASFSNAFLQLFANFFQLFLLTYLPKNLYFLLQLCLKVESLLQCLLPGANVIQLFTVVIYGHSMVILSLCATRQYCYGGMAENYNGKKFYNICPWVCFKNICLTTRLGFRKLLTNFLWSLFGKGVHYREWWGLFKSLFYS